MDPARIRAIIDVAVAQFEDFQRLREELAEANLKLAECKPADLLGARPLFGALQ